KAALALVRAKDTIDPEDVPTAHLLRTHRLATSISDAGWAAFLAILSEKAAGAGRAVVAVPPADTSPRWSGGGALVYNGASVRWHGCPEGGTSRHRDPHAAKNLKQEPQTRTASGLGKAFQKAWRSLRRRTEHPWGFCPCGVSTGALSHPRQLARHLCAASNEST